jgi:hypothetical protein
MSNSYYGYYGWGAWGMHWNTRAVVVRGGVWRVPPHPRYPYARPVPYYRPNINVYAPRYSSVNVDANRISNVNVNRNTVNVNGRTPRPTTLPAPPVATRGNPTSVNFLPPRGTTTSTRTSPPRGTTTPAVQPAKRGTTTLPSSSATRGGAARPPTTGANVNQTSRSRTQSYAGASPSTLTRSASPARQMQTGAATSAFSGYQKGSGEQVAAARGRSSATTGSGANRARN